MRRTPAFFAAVPFALLALLGDSLANPGVVFEITTTDFTSDPASVDVAQVEIEGANVAMGVSGAQGRGRMIFRGDEGEMIVVDETDRTYMQLDSAMVAGLAGQLSAAMSQMEQMLAQLPPEQRAMVEQMRERGMAGLPGMDGAASAAPEIDLRKTGRSDTKAGFAAEEWEVREDGALARRLWVAPWSEIDGGAEAREAMAGMVAFFDDFLAALPSIPGQDGPLIQNPFRNFDMGNGMPVVTEELGPDGRVEKRSTVTGVERRTLGPATFEPPEGFSRRALPGG
jgi:hypothetical protein